MPIGEEQMDHKTINVLYHSDEDGIAAAYAAWLKFQDSANYVRVQYGQPFPNITINSESEIYIVDFSYDRETLISLNEIVKKLVVLDHHKTAKDALEGLEFAKFAPSMSGATMAWHYFHPDVPMPVAIKLVEDYDLYKFDFPQTRAFIAGVSKHPELFDLYFWHRICNSISELETVMKHGEFMLEIQNNQVEKFKKSTEKWFLTTYKGKRVAVFNSTEDVNLRNRYAEVLYNDADLNIDFTISYLFKSDGGIILSFRAKNKETDVSQYAKALGGGGHETAAGVKVDFVIGVAILNLLYNKENVDQYMREVLHVTV